MISPWIARHQGSCGFDYSYAWTARGGTADTGLLSATDGPAPTFAVPDEVSEDEIYEYLLTVSSANAEDASAEVTVTVLNKESLALACADPGSVYEGSSDIAFDCDGFGCSRRLRLFVRVDGARRYGGHGPSQRYGRSRADVRGP